MADYYYSNCSTITVGCYLYIDIAKTTFVTNGYYSDGTNCYTVGPPSYANGYVGAITSCGFPVTVYSRAGDTLTADEYTVEWSQDGTNFTYLAGPLNSTVCTELSTVNVSSGTIYVRAVRDSNAAEVYIRGANSSTCPANLNVICTYSAAITGTESVAITVYVSGGDFLDC